MTDFSSSTVLITGGAGFIGSFIARRLVELGCRPVLQDSFVQYFSPTDSESSRYFRYLQERFKGIEGRMVLKRGDIRNPREIEQLIDEVRPDRIIHLAALPIAGLSDFFSEEAINTTIIGTTNLLDVCRNRDYISRFVYISSSMVYGHFQYEPVHEGHMTAPINVYGGVKLCGEILTQTYGRRFGVEYTIVRPSAVYGPTDVNRRVSQIFVEESLKGRPITLDGGGASKLDFTYVTDLANGIVLATFAENARNEIFNITRGEARSLKEFAEALKKYVPGLRIVEGKKDEHRPVRGALDISKARTMLGYSPQYSLEEGLQAYVRFVQMIHDELHVSGD